LNRAPLYFNYLVDRARALHPPRSAENKAKAVNFLLPHLNRLSNRIVRDELAADMAQKLGIDSVVLRQELRRAVAARSGTVKAPPEPAITDAERILLRALHPADDEISNLARHAAEVIGSEQLHQGLSSEPLIAAALAGNGSELSEAQRSQLSSILMREDEPLTTELIQGAIDALRRRRLEQRQRNLRARIVEAERRQDHGSLPALLQEKLKIDRELAARQSA
jgi:DNA primase